jgi:hypothetical protein
MKIFWRICYIYLIVFFTLFCPLRGDLAVPVSELNFSHTLHVSEIEVGQPRDLRVVPR